eukprot:TRINITY_DN9067_c0_g1_i3.p1 TRINITY_DN9067_c0_g1~~TRINITY_DN9067_c0_g1_i3.p1  ORF type:complete len:270 (+),score=60.57 TRINITY_DN9067_c0_g1_i3:109-810(+)
MCIRDRLRTYLHWEYHTISRGPTSIWEVLKREVGDPSEYIMFFGLRNHGKLSGIPVTEIVYVHSKLMIVDDKLVIMGSANINDRSMDGARDSEIAICVQDSKPLDVKMNGDNYAAAEFAHSLRVNLFMEHFGLAESALADPLSDELWKSIKDITHSNTMIYRQIFGCTPDDQMTMFNHRKELEDNRKPELYDELAPQIRGLAVEFPLYFLCDEDLLPPALKLEGGVVPEKTFH